MKKPDHAHHHHYDEGCLPLPRFERVKYFYGQLLGVREFQSEQSYFFEKHRLHNRYLHGYGVICGLEVEPCRSHDPCDEPPPKHEPPKGDPNQGDPKQGDPKQGDPKQGDPKQGDPVQYEQEGKAPSKALVRQFQPGPLDMPKKLCIQVDCGLALDCQGNEIVVPWPKQLDLLEVLGCDAKKFFEEGRQAYISLCYVARPVEPVRPVTADNCGGLLPDCVPSRLRDDYCIKVSWEEPPHDRACSPCKNPCCEPCLALASVKWTPELGPVIDNSIRRSISPYVTTKVVGVSWVHDGTYQAGDVDRMLRQGLEIEFSDDVYTTTLRRGVIDVWVLQGGDDRSGDIYHVPIDIEPSNKTGEFSRSVLVRLRSKKAADNIDPGDRVLIQLRSAHVLDRCCRPVDGDHIGGFVPQLGKYTMNGPMLMNTPIHPPCRRPDPVFGRWTSGNGTPGGNFESWFYVGADQGDEDAGDVRNYKQARGD
jgi:hypothetical protein